MIHGTPRSSLTLALLAATFACAAAGTADDPDAASPVADAAPPDHDAASPDAASPDAMLPPIDAAPPVLGPVQFDYTGAEQSFEVPAGVTSLIVEAVGAAGGDGYNTDNDPDTVRGLGGDGGRVIATVAVTPGEMLYIQVGGRGQDAAEGTPGLGGYNGGGDGADSQFNPSYYGAGGGGASDVRIGGQGLADRVVVAGGGGGGSGWCTDGNGTGGDGGDLTGDSGGMCTSIVPGTGGTQNAGGSSNGALGVGGATGLVGSRAGSGGGGGYYGGGASDGSGAGGGSSYAVPGAMSVVHTRGGNSGDGVVILDW